MSDFEIGVILSTFADSEHAALLSMEEARTNLGEFMVDRTSWINQQPIGVR